MGGGGSKASTKSDVVNDFVSKSMAESLMNCVTQTSVDQLIEITGNYNIVKDTEMKQVFNMSTNCYQDSNNMNQMINDISNSVSQSADAQNVALLGALSSSEADVDNYIYNGVKNEITASTVQNIVNATNAKQGIAIRGNHNIVENVTMNQIVDMISDNAQTSLNATVLMNTARSVVDQSATATQENPLDAITDMINGVMGGISSPIYLMVAIIGLVGIVLLYMLIGGKKNSKQVPYGDDYYDGDDYGDDYGEPGDGEEPGDGASNKEETFDPQIPPPAYESQMDKK